MQITHFLMARKNIDLDNVCLVIVYNHIIFLFVHMIVTYK